MIKKTNRMVQAELIVNSLKEKSKCPYNGHSRRYKRGSRVKKVARHEEELFSNDGALTFINGEKKISMVEFIVKETNDSCTEMDESMSDFDFSKHILELGNDILKRRLSSQVNLSITMDDKSKDIDKEESERKTQGSFNKENFGVLRDKHLGYASELANH